MKPLTKLREKMAKELIYLGVDEARATAFAVKWLEDHVQVMSNQTFVHPFELRRNPEAVNDLECHVRANALHDMVNVLETDTKLVHTDYRSAKPTSDYRTSMISWEEKEEDQPYMHERRFTVYLLKVEK